MPETPEERTARLQRLERWRAFEAHYGPIPLPPPLPDDDEAEDLRALLAFNLLLRWVPADIRWPSGMGQG